MPGIHSLGDIGGLDVLDIAFTRVQGIHFLLVNIQSQHVHSGAGKLQG